MADTEFSGLSRCTGLVRLASSHEARHMAYPFGEFNAQVRALAVEAGYQTARALGQWLDRKARGVCRPVRGTGVQPA